MNAEKIEKAKSQLAAYGYTLSDSFQIEKGEKTFSVVVSAKGPRFYVKQLSGAPLWSGPDLGEFVRSFWYAKKIEQPMRTNGKGIYHETPAGKHDMVLHQDHRGAWRIDLVTSAGGNHLDVTGPNRGYGSPEEAFQAALDVQRTRGIRGKSHVYIADRDGNLSDYEPMEVSGDAEKYESGSGPYSVHFETGSLASGDKTIYHLRRPTLKAAKIEALAQEKLRGGIISVTHRGREVWDTSKISQTPNGNSTGEEWLQDSIPIGAQEDDYVFDIVDRDGNIGLWRVTRGNRLMEIETSASIDTIARAAEQDARSRGIQDAVVFDHGESRQVGHVLRGRWEVEMETNGRATTVDTVAARELDLYIANTHELVGAPNSIGKSIDTNLKRKLANGTYDSALAPKAWQHLVDQGAKRYEKEFGDSSLVFNAATRRQVAADFAAAWEEENGMRANGLTNETNLRQAITDALHSRPRKHLEIWRTVSQRYPSTVYADFDALMGKMEMDGTITLTGSRGPNTYKLT
jgi:hypothetical protein